MTLHRIFSTLWVALLASTSACRATPAQSPPAATPVYNTETGRLEALVSDRNGDGRLDTRALMEGTRVVRIEIDRDADGVVDRREFYGPSASDPNTNTIERAEDSTSGGQVSRVEYYGAGGLTRVEEDTDADGRLDKWEFYERGRLIRLELDLLGAGRPTQRLRYGRGGIVDGVESDPDGDGRFTPVTTPPAFSGGRASGGAP